jgi:hypothetical protein
MSGRSTQINNNTSNLLNASRQLDSVIKAKNVDKIDFRNGAVNLNYRHQFNKKGYGITADANYLSYRNKTNQVYNNYSYFPDRSLKSQDILSGSLPSNIDIYTLKTDYFNTVHEITSYAQSLELSHTYKNKYTTTVSYSSTKDDMNETIEIVNGIYYSRPTNIGRKTVKSISFNGVFNPAGWLNINLYTELTKIKTVSDFYTGKLNTSSTYFYISSNANITLGSGWDAELSGNYSTR